MDDDFLTQALSDLPKTSNAFSRIKNVSLSVVDVDPTASPPRKWARTGQDQDISRNKGKGKARAQGEVPGKGSNPKVQVLRVGNMIPARALPLEYTNRLRPLVTRSLRAILDAETTGGNRIAPFEEIFQAVHVLVSLQGEGEDLYGAVKMALEKCVDIEFRKLMTKPLGNMKWLAQLVEVWQWYESRLSILTSVLLYLDRIFVLGNADRSFMQVRTLGRVTWREKLARMTGPQTSISGALSEWVTQERDSSLGITPSGSGMDVDQSSHRNTIRSLVRLLAIYEVYEVVFEASYADITKEYYKNESRQLYDESRAVDWIQHCSVRLDQEEKRLKDCCSEFPSHRIISIVQDRLIRQNITEKFSQIAIESFMNEKDERGLSQMYNLYRRVQALLELRHAFRSYVKTLVQAEAHKPDNDVDMIPNLISLKGFVDAVVNTCFKSRICQGGTDVLPSGGDGFTHAIRDAFSAAIGTRKSKPAELMAKQLDTILRQGQKGMSDSEFQKKVDEVMALHAFTPDRDVFRSFYMRALAKRVILQRSASDDFEKQFLAKLAESYDREFEKGLQMFNDLELSRNLQKEFSTSREHVGHSVEDCDALSVLVLQPSAWPTYRSTPLLLPSGMQAAIDHFHEFYNGKFKGRQLQWIHNLGTASLRARFPKGEKDLVLSLEQACILLLFAAEGVKKLTFGEIHEQTNMDKEDLKRSLQSLALGKKRVLKKQPQSKDVNGDDVFFVNSAFEDEKRIVRINNIQVKESAAENAQVAESIGITRDLQLQAAIVRIMKARKALSHSELTTATVDAVKQHFHPDVPMIKAQISQLVEMEYLERDENDSSLYRYLA